MVRRRWEAGRGDRRTGRRYGSDPPRPCVTEAGLREAGRTSTSARRAASGTGEGPPNAWIRREAAGPAAGSGRSRRAVPRGAGLGSPAWKERTWPRSRAWASDGWRRTRRGVAQARGAAAWPSRTRTGPSRAQAQPAGEQAPAASPPIGSPPGCTCGRPRPKRPSRPSRPSTAGASVTSSVAPTTRARPAGRPARPAEPDPRPNTLEHPPERLGGIAPSFPPSLSRPDQRTSPPMGRHVGGAAHATLPSSTGHDRLRAPPTQQGDAASHAVCLWWPSSGCGLYMSNKTGFSNTNYVSHQNGRFLSIGHGARSTASR
jgi:hypothetical protein